MMTKGVLAVAMVSQMASVAAAGELLRSKGATFYQYSAKRAAGLGWGDKAVVHMLGTTKQGATILTVRSPKLAQAKFFIGAPGKYGWGEVKELTAAQMKKYGIVAEKDALKAAKKNNGRYGKVKGTTTFDGMSTSGESYRFTTTSAKPVQIKDTWHTETVSKVRRYVNVLNGAESAAGLDSKFERNPR